MLWFLVSVARLISRLFDKNFMEEDWLPPSLGVLGSLSMCLLVQWSMTIWALASECLRPRR